MEESTDIQLFCGWWMFNRCLFLLVTVLGFASFVAKPATASTTITAQLPLLRHQSPSVAIGDSDFFSEVPTQWNPYNNSSQSEAARQFESSSFELVDVPVQDANRSGRPRGIPVGLEAEWISDTGVSLTNYGSSLKLPLLFGSKSPPPIVKIGFAYTDFSAPDSLGVPEDLFEYSIGLSGVKRFNERWAIRTMLGVDFATDNQNTSSDAWRFTGGVFAIYKQSPSLSWTFGALALGRSDLPVVPAIGAVWLPNATTRIDLILPNPKANFLLSDNGTQQHWAYLGGGLNGNTWAFERPDSVDETLTYRDLRLVAGWEVRPSAPANAPYVVGRKYVVEVGYAFSRDLEFENESIEVPLDEALTFRLSTQY